MLLEFEGTKEKLQEDKKEREIINHNACILLNNYRERTNQKIIKLSPNMKSLLSQIFNQIEISWHGV